MTHYWLWQEETQAWEPLIQLPPSWLNALSMGGSITTSYHTPLTAWAWGFHQQRLQNTLQACFPTYDMTQAPPWLTTPQSAAPKTPLGSPDSTDSPPKGMRLLGIPYPKGTSSFAAWQCYASHTPMAMAWVLQERSLPVQSSSPITVQEILWHRQGFLTPYKLGGTLLEGLWEQAQSPQTTLMWVRNEHLTTWLETPIATWCAWCEQPSSKAAPHITLYLPHPDDDNQRLQSTSLAILRYWANEASQAQGWNVQAVHRPPFMSEDLTQCQPAFPCHMVLVNALRGLQPVGQLQGLAAPSTVTLQTGKSLVYRHLQLFWETQVWG